MTRIASNQGLITLMAVDAPFHLYRLLGNHRVLQRNITMASFALYVCRSMFGVAKEHEVRHFINSKQGYGSCRHIHVACLALFQRWEACQIATDSSLMA